jgi:hypothetical protein
MKHCTEGHTEITISSDSRADWSERLSNSCPASKIEDVWASVFTGKLLSPLPRIAFFYLQQIIWNKGRTVLTKTHYWYQHEPCC